MKRMIILFAAAFMMAAIFPISAGAGDNGTTLTANLLDLRVSGTSTPPGSEFWLIFQIWPPSYVDSVEVRYEKKGEFTRFRTNVMEGPRPLLSPSMLPIVPGGPTVVQFFADIPFGDTSSILLSVSYKGQPVDSMGMSFYREGDSVVFSRQTFPPPPQPPRNSEYEMEGDVAYMPFGPSLEIISKPHLYGMMSFQLTVLLNYPYDSLIITAIPVGKLVFENSDRWIIHPSDAAKVTIPIDVSIPPDDTSGFQIKIADEKGPANAIWRHFVTTGDTLEIYYFKPEPREETRGQLYITPEGDTLTEEQIINEYIPRRDSLRNIPDTSHIKETSYLLPEGILARTEQGRKELLEREPLTDHRTQTIVVDGQYWIRDSGEYKFRPAKTIKSPTDPDYVPGSFPGDTMASSDTIHVTMDLQNQADYERVRTLMQSITPTGRVGYYHGWITRKNLKELEKRNIRFCPYPAYPDSAEIRHHHKPKRPKDDNGDQESAGGLQL